MARVNVYDYSDGEAGQPPRLVGHFDIWKADEWTDADGNGNGSGGTGRGQSVLRTAQGRWVLRNWTRWQGEADTFEFITPDAAQEWLLRHNEDDAVTAHFGEIEEERGPGRPAIGPRLAIPFPDDIRAKVKARAAELNTSEAGVVRDIVADHFNG